MSRTALFHLLLVFALARTPVFGDGAGTSVVPAKPVAREWTSSDGKKLVAEYLGVLDGSVYLGLTSGKTVPVALAKLSSGDQSFIAANPREFHRTWSGWPGELSATLSNQTVSEAAGTGGKFVYTTRHFRFETDVNLGRELTKDLACLFEATHALNSSSPFGILADPDDGYFRAELFGTLDAYRQNGGPVNTAGVYKIPQKRFLAPLELMGLVKGSDGWRTASRKAADTTTIIHELTHMLSHDMLQPMPLWFSEGYAEYLSNIPVENNTFRTGSKAISSEVLKLMAQEYFIKDGIPRTTADIGFGGGGSSKNSQQTSPKKLKYQMRSVSEMLEMADSGWCISGGNPTFPGVEAIRRLRYYRTAHLIVFYFIEIEGERGLAKLRAMLDCNRLALAKYNAYVADMERYRAAMDLFKQQPGVKQLPDGRVEYPTTLTPPAPPLEKPAVDPKHLKQEGVKALLNGESAAVVGERIENALRSHFGVSIDFTAK
ncbi:MAG: hypothetical protein J0M04_11605 [Verrucomicrobia bacterium]|nr:hypothetical protein [Verrucomicrobiota bacterium]